MANKGAGKARMLASQSQLKSILDASPIGVSISRYYDGKIIYVNSTLANMKRAPAEELLGSDSIDHYYDQDAIRWVISQLRQRRPVTNHEMEMNRADGTTVWCQVNMVATVVDDERMILTWFNDVDEIRRARAKLQYAASHDSLTGLANRVSFNEFMSGAIARSRRLNQAGGLLYLDLDSFKAVNDRLGHNFGDYLLQQVAKRLTLALRDTDFVARLGGDEFAVVFEGLSDRVRPEQVADKILDIVAQPYEHEGQRATIGASIGIAHFGREAEDIDAIIKRADRAMYRAKHGGKGRTCVYAPCHNELGEVNNARK